MSTFASDVVAAICRHMNEDHRENALLICRQLAAVDDAQDVEAVDVDTDGTRFSVRTAEGVREVVVAFARPVVERSQVRGRRRAVRARLHGSRTRAATTDVEGWTATGRCG